MATNVSYVLYSLNMSRSPSITDSPWRYPERESENARERESETRMFHLKRQRERMIERASERESERAGD